MVNEDARLPVITIVDSTDRRAKLAKVFGALATIQAVYASGEDCQVVVELGGKHRNSPEPAFASLCHVSDKSFLPKENATIENTVFYSGGGITEGDLRLPDGAMEWISRCVDDDASMITHEEAEQICTYLQLPCFQRTEETRPPILRRMRYFTVLHALSILCQGYLAVWACDDGTPFAKQHRADYDRHDEALEKMGWKSLCKPRLPSYLIGEKERLATRDNMAQPRAWADTLGDKKTIQEELGQLSEEGEAVCELVNAIWDTQGKVRATTISCGEVARAYLGLAQVPL